MQPPCRILAIYPRAAPREELARLTLHESERRCWTFERNANLEHEEQHESAIFLATNIRTFES
ncbi:MAG: hypothetical protein QM516_04825, partial [Limnohabitans sp.]|nr:hypothetical protein [Limnohabitans sp.]